MSAVGIGGTVYTIKSAATRLKAAAVASASAVKRILVVAIVV